MSEQNQEKWRYYTDVRLWPVRVKMNPAAWIQNFRTDEVPLALRLLDGFTYYSTPIVEQMFRSAVASISQHTVVERASLAVARRDWQRYLDDVLIVRVTGESPSDADSGYIFTRMARDILGIEERRIATAQQALSHLYRRGTGHVIFVDDFVGSGNQFADTWHREYEVAEATGRVSFASAAAELGENATFFYSPVLCTNLGRQEIKRRCPSVTIVPAHFLSERHSAISPDSFIWRDDMRSEGPDFVRSVSSRAGIPDMAGNPGCWRGFCGLGLAVAFEHGCPDATLPLFTWGENQWYPLLSYVPQ